jgi:hypothetical protein
MSFIRTIKKGDKIYYQEVENKWINGKTVQKHIRYIGRDKERPDHIPIEKVQFRFIATGLMQGDLTPNELFDMIEKMGHHVSRENLERIGIYYNFKKNSFSLSLYRKRLSGKQKDASGAGKD